MRRCILETKTLFLFPTRRARRVLLTFWLRTHGRNNLYFNVGKEDKTVGKKMIHVRVLKGGPGSTIDQSEEGERAPARASYFFLSFLSFFSPGSFIWEETRVGFLFQIHKVRFVSRWQCSTRVHSEENLTTSSCCKGLNVFSIAMFSIAMFSIAMWNCLCVVGISKETKRFLERFQCGFFFFLNPSISPFSSACFVATGFFKTHREFKLRHLVHKSSGIDQKALGNCGVWSLKQGSFLVLNKKTKTSNEKTKGPRIQKMY